jgi:hypothetical protein
MADRQIEVERHEAPDADVGGRNDPRTDDRSFADFDVTANHCTGVTQNRKTRHVAPDAFDDSSFRDGISDANHDGYVRVSHKPTAIAEDLKVMNDGVVLAGIVVEEAQDAKHAPLCVDVFEPLTALAAEAADPNYDDV